VIGRKMESIPELAHEPRAGGPARLSYSSKVCQKPLMLRHPRRIEPKHKTLWSSPSLAARELNKQGSMKRLATASDHPSPWRGTQSGLDKMEEEAYRILTRIV
jgi:hypothetical protein